MDKIKSGNCQNVVHFDVGLPLLWNQPQNQIYLGSQDLVEKMQDHIKNKIKDFMEFSRAQEHCAGELLSYYAEKCT